MVAQNVEVKYDGVEVFSATMAKTRDQLSERVENWLRDHKDYEVVETIVTQSSDSAYHCLTLTLFYRHR